MTSLSCLLFVSTALLAVCIQLSFCRLLNSTIGCYIDNSSRDLPMIGPQIVDYMTLTYCSQYCYQQVNCNNGRLTYCEVGNCQLAASTIGYSLRQGWRSAADCDVSNKQGYKYAGAQATSSCFCGNTYGGLGEAPITDCSSICPGDPTQSTKCGSDWRNTIVYTGFGSTQISLLYRDARLTNVNTDCFHNYSNVRCVNRCLSRDSNGCTALQYDANSRQCCFIVERYSSLIGTTYSAGVSVWVVV